MSKVLNACLPWLNWKVVVVLGCALLGIMFYAERSGWGLWMAVTPLLGIAACLLPCLIPLVFLWRKSDERNEPSAIEAEHVN